MDTNFNTNTNSGTNSNQDADRIGQQASQAADQAANRAEDALRSTQRATNSAIEGISAKVDDLRTQAGPLINKVSAQAEAAARRGMEAVRDTSQQLRERASVATDSTVGYIKDEPIKSMLIAAATGAVLMGLVNMMGRSRHD
jgi:ElaB/YqjD/DUF883 family membrane-anchored ribosome-binding protein